MSQYRLFRLWHIFREESNPDQRYNEGDKGKNGIEYCPAHRSRSVPVYCGFVAQIGACARPVE